MQQQSNFQPRVYYYRDKYLSHCLGTERQSTPIPSKSAGSGRAKFKLPRLTSLLSARSDASAAPHVNSDLTGCNRPPRKHDWSVPHRKTRACFGSTSGSSSTDLKMARSALRLKAASTICPKGFWERRPSKTEGSDATDTYEPSRRR